MYLLDNLGRRRRAEWPNIVGTYKFKTILLMKFTYSLDT